MQRQTILQTFHHCLIRSLQNIRRNTHRRPALQTIKQSGAIATVLAGRGVPFVVASGQAAPAWAKVGTPQLDKPYSTESLAKALETLFAQAV